MFKKLTACVSTGLEKVTEFSQKQITDALFSRYPDINEVLEVLQRIKGEANEAIEGKLRGFDGMYLQNLSL